jgi:hypothetical protein
MIPEFAQPKSEHALNHTATQIGSSSVTCNILPAVVWYKLATLLESLSTCNLFYMQVS